jgi:hypothetical protein
VRLFANENFPRAAIEALRARGHDVAWVPEVCPSTEDTEILTIATREGRILVTLDKDFGELAFRSGLPANSGIILFRLPPDPALVTEVATKVLSAGADFAGRFVVVELGRIRERPLPSASGGTR